MLRTLIMSLACTVLITACARAQDDAVKAKEENSAEAKQKPSEPRKYETTGSVVANGKTVRYAATAEETYIYNDKGEPRASIFSTTYIASGFGDPTKRPVAFIYNGGPGSASLWLHMGVFGPKRLHLPDGPDDDGAPPYEVTPNAQSILDVADLVFIDPVGTGWSKALGETKPDDFWGVSEDAASLREFIRRWLVAHQRWNSPKYLIGESYGTTRSGALINELENGWTDIAVNGIVLISSVLNFSLDATDPGNDIGYVGLLPGYAAAAWYHEKVDRSQWSGDLQRFLAEARAFATDDYMPALLKGQLLGADARQQIIARMASFTGLSEQYISQANMRVSLGRFMRELMRDEGLTVGRLDSRFTGVEPDGVAEYPDDDPSAYGIDGAYTAAMLDYFGRELKVDISEPYVTLGGVRKWNWNTRKEGGGDNSYVNVAPYIERAMRQNKDLRVLSANGYYDLATPFFGTEMTLAQPAFDRKRLTITYYDAGHMMYIHEPSLIKLTGDIRDFIAAGRQ